MRYFRRRTFASLWGGCLRFASLCNANSRGDSSVLGVHLSNVCWGLIFCLRKAFICLKSLLNLRKAYIDLCLLNLPKRSSYRSLLLIVLRIKSSYFSAWFVTVCGICVRLLVHASNQLSSAAFVLQINILSCVARWPLCHKVNLPRCEARRRHLIMNCDILIAASKTKSHL